LTPLHSEDQFQKAEAHRRIGFRSVLVILFVVEFFLLSAVTLWGFTRITSYLEGEEKRNISELVEKTLKRNETWARTLLESAANSRYIQATFHDKDALYDYSYPILNRWRKQGLRHLNYYTLDGKIRLRVADPNDQTATATKTSWLAAREGKVIFRVEAEQGQVYTFAASPFYGSGREIGIVEMGIDLQPILEEIKTVLGSEVGVVLKGRLTKATDNKIESSAGRETLKTGGKEFKVYRSNLDQNGEIALLVLRDVTFIDQTILRTELLIVAVFGLISASLFWVIINKILKKMDEQSGRLIEANRELELIAYTATHDLKNPIVSLHGMASLLFGKYRDALDEKGKYYVNRIITNTTIMGQLITDLGTLFQIQKKREILTLIQPEEIIKEVLSDCNRKIVQMKIEVRLLSPLPTLIFDRVWLKEIFLNLITNAIKFMGDQSSPLIEIGGRRLKESVEFHVRDNGIGIDPRYRDQVFLIFSRLQDVEAEGTGIGLALVKKIVDLGKGTIWFESKKGEGTTFFFRFPRSATKTPGGTGLRIADR